MEGENGFCYFFSNDFGRKFVKTIKFILKVKVIALDLGFLLCSTIVLLLLGTNYLQNKGVGRSPSQAQRDLCLQRCCQLLL